MAIWEKGPSENRLIIRTIDIMTNIEKEVYLSIFRYRAGKIFSFNDYIVVEKRLRLFFNGKLIRELTCCPTFLSELAVGLFYTEGIITSMDEISKIEIKENPLSVEIYSSKKEKVHYPELLPPSISDLEKYNPIGPKEPFLDPEELISLAEVLKNSSILHLKTGALHSALFKDKRGYTTFDDISRYNSLDKAIGDALIKGVDFKKSFLLVSSRIPAGILWKVYRAGIPAIISVSAPTYLAIRIADKLGITLIGFLREGRMNIYSHRERLLI